LGESWGSALGIWMMQRDPALFHAFIGTGQMVAFLENDLICYDFVLKLMQEQGNKEAFIPPIQVWIHFCCSIRSFIVVWPMCKR
jgi:hypothetical protein